MREQSRGYWRGMIAAASIVLTVIGFGGLPDDLQAWDGWIGNYPEHIKVGLVVVGVLGLVFDHWPRSAKAAYPSPTGSRDVQEVQGLLENERIASRDLKVALDGERMAREKLYATERLEDTRAILEALARWQKRLSSGNAIPPEPVIDSWRRETRRIVHLALQGDDRRLALGAIETGAFCDVIPLISAPLTVERISPSFDARKELERLSSVA